MSRYLWKFMNSCGKFYYFNMEHVSFGIIPSIMVTPWCGVVRRTSEPDINTVNLCCPANRQNA